MKIKKITEEEIIFDNNYRLYYDHEQDCCEINWADFEMLKSYNLSTQTGKAISIYEEDFATTLTELFYKGVTDAGFMIKSKTGNNFFIPCYSDQNGYYTTQLILYLYHEDTKITEELDVTSYVEERYD